MSAQEEMPIILWNICSYLSWGAGEEFFQLRAEFLLGRLEGTAELEDG